MTTDEADAWIWAAIAMATKHPENVVDWSEVIGAADAINHAIPTDQEIAHAVNRLLDARLLESSGRDLVVTKAMLDTYKSARSEAQDGMFDVARQLVKHLPPTGNGSTSWTPAPGTTDGAYWKYTRRTHGPKPPRGNTASDSSYERMVLKKAKVFHPAVLSWYRMADDGINEPDQNAYFEAIGRTVVELAQREWIIVGVCRPASHPRIERRLNQSEIQAIFGPDKRWWEYETSERWIGVECSPSGLEALENELS